MDPRNAQVRHKTAGVMLISLFEPQRPRGPQTRLAHGSTAVPWLVRSYAASPAGRTGMGRFSLLVVTPGYWSPAESCTDQFCSRYMVGTRGKGEVSTGTNHLGFRCVKTV